jgi:hypothetical protein
MRVISIHPERASTTVTPGLREPGRLTRFAPSVLAMHTTVDGTMDAATIADRQREGGGSPAERRPARASWWSSLVAGIRRGQAPPSPALAPGDAATVVELNPKLL